MRRELIQALTQDEAFDKCPWAAICVPVVEGILCFESLNDFDIWTKQV